MAQGRSIIMIQVQPGASQNRVASFTDDVWHLKIAAPPTRGKANRELVKFLSDILETARSNITIEKGQTSRNKVIAIRGLTPAEVNAQLLKHQGHSA
ncbi:MAG: YggU family protein [Dehalococcoidales bacterium]|nr:MAG: YggU family protein [Dehalococcoidales bacterium]